MITERELRRLAAKAGLGVGETEHEYAMLCILDTLGQTAPLADTFCLKGGTALRLIYFVDWRHSVDLDFSVLPAFPAAALRQHIEHWFSQVAAIHGVTVRPLDFHRANGAARIRAQFVGPLQHPARLLFDITLDEPLLLTPQRREVVLPHFLPLRPTVLVYTLEEILVEKLRSILQRGKTRDYYDVWRLLKEKQAEIDSARARSILEEKCRHKGLEDTQVSTFLMPQRLKEAQPYWERDLARQIAPHPLPEWELVTQELEGLLAQFLESCER